jgi:glucan 1,3-beta-glucosidase
MVGEAWSVIAGSGPSFQNYNYPKPVVQVGSPGTTGIVEITDIVFTTVGPGE